MYHLVYDSLDEDLSDDNETVDLIDDKEMHQEEHGKISF